MAIPKPTPHVAILTSAAMGQIIPIIELGNRIIKLAHHHHQDFQVTIFVPTTTDDDASSAQSQLLSSLLLPHGLHIFQLKPADLSNITAADALMEARISIVLKESLQSLRSAILEMANPPIAIIVDIFGTDAFELADELGMLKYLFVTTTAAFTAMMMYLPTLDKELVTGEYIDLKEPIQVPGCNPIRIEDLIGPMRARKSGPYKSMLHQASRYPTANGVLVNTSEELEPKAIAAMRENPALKLIPTPPIYPIGPLTRSSAGDGAPVYGDHRMNSLLSWLNKQPSGSVLFVSFGSGGTVSAEQMTEIAWGLELSGQRFIWVVRAPTKRDGSGTYFTAGGGGGEPLDYLPQGFLTRTSGTGLILPSWAPQLEILRHGSIGGFLSHCGWNSVLESIVHGVPMIAWPLYAEQKMNASALVEDIGVAIRTSKTANKELVLREKIEKAVRMLMEKPEGRALKTRVMELKESVLKALEEGGSAYNSLAELIKEWRAGLPCKKSTETKE